MTSPQEWVQKLTDSDNYINLFFDEVNRLPEEEAVVLALQVLKNIPVERKAPIMMSEQYDKFVRRYERILFDEEKISKLKERAQTTETKP